MENRKAENPKPGDRSPVPPYHLPCHENFPDFFSYLFLDFELLYDYHDNQGNQKQTNGLYVGERED